MASIGITSLLVASSVLLLVVVSAIVAFNGWPGGSFADRGESVLLEEGDRTVALSGPDRVAADAAPAAAAVAGAAGPAGDAGAGGVLPGTGGVLSEERGAPDGGGDSGDPSPPPATVTPPDALIPTDPRTPDDGDSPLIPDAPDVDPPTLTDRLADTTETLSAGLGGALDGAGETLGSSVRNSGRAVSPGTGDLTDGVGQTVDGAGAGAGGTVSGTGDAVAEIVRLLP